MSFEPQKLLDEASAAAGNLKDFGDPTFRGGLDALCKALNSEARLSEMGAGILKQKIVAQLMNRLRVEDYFGKHPEIGTEKVEAPLVIVGLPRTGTTKLHRLLSRDPRFWWMAFWESQFPLPFPGEVDGKPEARIAEGHKLVEMMTTAMPKLMAIHPMAAEEADEEMMLMEHSMLSAFDAYAQIPSYTAWFAETDAAPAYRYLARMLQHLQWQKRQRGLKGQRWVLKAPHHMHHLETLLAVFPGVQVIQTHRDPVRSIPSIASFIDTLQRIYSDHVDATVVGKVWSHHMRSGLDNTMSVRDTVPAQFLDVPFEDTVRQPLDVVRRVYDFIGWELTAEVLARMRAWLIEDERSHSAAHDYAPDAFGLSEAQLVRDFATYRTRHIGT